MVNSEEHVQTEGVQALVMISKEILKAEEAKPLVLDIIHLILCKEDVSEGARIACLLIIQRFAEEQIFKKEESILFINNFMGKFKKGMLFKMKKFLLPTLIAISPFLDYDMFVKEVFSLFWEFTEDEIWGVRKVCVELTLPMIKLIKDSDLERLKLCINFIEKSLND